MRKILSLILMFACTSLYAQTYLEYVSEKADSMVVINKKDVDIINNVFHEKFILDSLNNINEQIISTFEISSNIQSSIIESQSMEIDNYKSIVSELELKNKDIVDTYSKKLKKEKAKKISFQTTTGLGIITIILLLLL